MSERRVQVGSVRVKSGRECEWVDQDDSVDGEKRPRVRKDSSDWECERKVQAESVSGELRLGVYAESSG